jgi:hypothetical protein
MLQNLNSPQQRTGTELVGFLILQKIVSALAFQKQTRVYYMKSCQKKLKQIVY